MAGASSTAVNRNGSASPAFAHEGDDGGRRRFHRCMNPSVSVRMKLTSAFSSSAERPSRPMNLVFMLAVNSGAGQHVMPFQQPLW
jgi:hypothetical protein